MIPRVYKYRTAADDVYYVCIDERGHDNFFHQYYWSGRKYDVSGRRCGNFKMAVTDWNRIVKSGRITSRNEK